MNELEIAHTLNIGLIALIAVLIVNHIRIVSRYRYQLELTKLANYPGALREDGTISFMAGAAADQKVEVVSPFPSWPANGAMIITGGLRFIYENGSWMHCDKDGNILR